MSLSLVQHYRRYFVREPPDAPLVPRHLERRKRRAMINAAIGNKKKRKNCGKDEISQQLTWTDVQRIFYPITSEYNLVPKKVPDEEFDSLYKYLTKAGRSFSSIGLGSDALWLHFIAPVLVHVCNLFDGEVKILVNQTVDGKNVLVHGQFEFILQRNGKRVCVVEAKHDDLEQGLVQDLLGCEAMADMEDLECVYGIVTNYPTWIFINSLDHRIETCELSLGITRDRTPTKDTLEAVVGSIYAMLSD